MSNETVIVGGIKIARLNRDQLANQMVADVACMRAAEIKPLPKIVTSANGSVIARYHSESEFKKLIDKADIVDADGMSLVIASKLFTKSGLEERVATTDFVLNACEAASENNIRFYFFGGTAENNSASLRKLSTLFPQLEIVGSHHGYVSEQEIRSICAEITALKTDVLWVGLGTPKQEQFAFQYRPLLSGVAWIRTCGGLFDHYSGNTPRAPKWMQSVGLEWLFRACLEPRRLGMRYLRTNVPAIYHMILKSR